MKKLALLIMLTLCLMSKSWATSISMPYCNAQTGGFIYASQWNANCSAIQTFLNNQNIDGTTNIATGGVQTSNIANLAVTDAKIAGITTAGKVNGSALSGLNNIPSGSGIIPNANLNVGTGSGQIPQLTSTANAAATAYLMPVSTIGTLLGSWTSQSFGTVYQASTDLLVQCNSTVNNTNANIYTDSSNPPTTSRSNFGSNASTGNLQANLMSAVKKGDYYECQTNGSGVFMYYLTIGS